MEHQFYDRLVHIPSTFKDGAKPHIVKIAEGWLALWPQQIKPTPSQDRQMKVFLDHLAGVTTPQPKSLMYLAPDVLQ